mmetsp:Transcript_21058/g.37302  ORF Transcript_21058/g.37302 Transcript_21058/m.37302 type:complete len:208 (+) Transcript_21058:1569-2192(+)
MSSRVWQFVFITATIRATRALKPSWSSDKFASARSSLAKGVSLTCVAVASHLVMCSPDKSLKASSRTVLSIARHLSSTLALSRSSMPSISARPSSAWNNISRPRATQGGRLNASQMALPPVSLPVALPASLSSLSTEWLPPQATHSSSSQVAATNAESCSTTWPAPIAARATHARPMPSTCCTSIASGAAKFIAARDPPQTAANLTF